MKYLLKFLEKYSNFNYEYIIKKMVSDYNWGNSISNEIENFENSDSSIPSNDDEYIILFNDYLFKKYKKAPSIYNNNVTIKQPIGWYGKST